MATSKRTAIETEVQEQNPVEEENGTAASNEMQERIAKLEAQLAAERAKSAGYRRGNDAEVVEKAIQDATAANLLGAEGKDLWEVRVSVRVPERRDTNEKSYWIMVNGRSVQLPADNKCQEMRLPFAEALMNTLKADRFAQNFAENAIQVYDPRTNPHPEK